MLLIDRSILQKDSVPRYNVEYKDPSTGNWVSYNATSSRVGALDLAEELVTVYGPLNVRIVDEHS